VKSLFTLLAGVSVAAAGAFAQTGVVAQGAADKTAPSSTRAATSQMPADKNARTDKAPTLAKADADFMKQAAQNGLAEVEASKLAQTKAKSADIKSFAGKMVTEHTKANDELMKLAADKGVKLPDKPSLMQRTKLKMLSSADGDNFDKRYADGFGVKAHEDTVKLFQEEGTKGKDADVKMWAQKTLPDLQEHLTLAKSMQASVEPTATGKPEKTSRAATKSDKAEKKY
jgi:putative membrane protein